MKVYLQFAAFTFHKKMRRSNVFILTLNFHDSNLNEIFDALSFLRSLDKEIVFDLSQSTRVCAFSLCITKNMFQQQTNAICKFMRAIFDCRFCFILNEKRKNLEYDIIQKRRFHNQIMQQRRKLNAIRAVTAKKTYAAK